MAEFTIAGYSITLTSMANGHSWIMVYNAAGGTINRARLDFVSSQVGKVTVSGSMVRVNMDMSSFSQVIDTLRNERAVKFCWFPSWAGVTTGHEPVGEGEIS